MTQDAYVAIRGPGILACRQTRAQGILALKRASRATGVKCNMEGLDGDRKGEAVRTGPPPAQLPTIATKRPKVDGQFDNPTHPLIALSPATIRLSSARSYCIGVNGQCSVTRQRPTQARSGHPASPSSRISAGWTAKGAGSFPVWNAFIFRLSAVV
jgi:hypothetical protein